MIFTFNALPIASGNISVKVTLYGDFDHSSEYATIFTGPSLSSLTGGLKHEGGSPQCDVNGHPKTFTSPSSHISSQGVMVVRVDLSSAVNLICSNITERVVVELSYTSYKPSNPDIYASFISITGDTKQHNSNFTVKYRIYNRGALLPSTLTSFLNYFYYCPKSNTSGCSNLGSQTIPTTSFSSGTTFTRALSMPSSAIYGTGYIRIYADAKNAIQEYSEANNNSWRAISVTTRPDLDIISSNIPHTGTIAGPGAEFTSRLVIRNNTYGSRVTTDYAICYSYCDQKSTSGCVSLSQQTIKTDLNSGISTITISKTLTMPPQTSPGTRYIYAEVDCTETVIERNESNNGHFHAITVPVPPPSPELAVQSLNIKSLGSTVTYEVTVCNNGEDAPASKLYLYNDQTSTPSCHITPDRIIDLAAIDKYLCVTHSFVRNDVPEGSYMAWAFADATCSIEEDNENNNTKSTNYTIGNSSDGGTDGDVITDGGGMDGGVTTADSSQNGDGAVTPPDGGCTYARNAGQSNSWVLILVALAALALCYRRRE